MTQSAADLARLGAAALVTAYAGGDLSPVEVADAVAEVVEDREPTLNALWVRDLDAAREAAQASSAAGRPVSRWAHSTEFR